VLLVLQLRDQNVQNVLDGALLQREVGQRRAKSGQLRSVSRCLDDTLCGADLSGHTWGATMAIIKRDRWTEANIDALPTDEPAYFDRKSGDLFNNEGELLGKLAKSLSAFANSGGGYIILGVDDTGVPDGVPPMRSDRTSTRDWLEQKLPFLVDRPLTDFNVYVVERGTSWSIPPDRQVVVIEVDDSPLAPHQAVHGGGGTTKFVYYHRQGGRSEPAPHRVLELLHQRQLAARAIEAAERSAHAAERTAETMAHQRIEASQPLVVGRLHAVALVDGRLTSIECELQNIGNGPALGVNARLTVAGEQYGLAPRPEGCPTELAAQSPQPTWQGSFRLSPEQPGPRQEAKNTPAPATLTIEYRDVYGREFEATTDYAVPFTKFPNYLTQTRPLTVQVKKSAAQ
jgi:hypothetical protein